jgi:hypothetical protein
LSESVRSRVIALPSPFTLEIAFPSATTTRSVDPHARNSSSVVNRFSDTSIARNRSQLSTPLSVVKPFARKSNRVNDAHDASARAAPIDVVANHRARSPDASARVVVVVVVAENASGHRASGQHSATPNVEELLWHARRVPRLRRVVGVRQKARTHAEAVRVADVDRARAERVRGEAFELLCLSKGTTRHARAIARE